MTQQPPLSSDLQDYRELTKSACMLAGLGALVLLIIAGSVFYAPPASITTKEDGQGSVIERTTSRNGDSTVTIAVFGAAIGCLFFALNGLRFVRVGAAGISAESATVATVVRNVKTPDEIQALWGSFGILMVPELGPTY